MSPRARQLFDETTPSKMHLRMLIQNESGRNELGITKTDCEEELARLESARPSATFGAVTPKTLVEA